VITDDEVKRNVAANTRQLRGHRTRAWLARSTGAYPIHITRIERGECNPRGAMLARIAAALETTVDALISSPRKKTR